MTSNIFMHVARFHMPCHLANVHVRTLILILHMFFDDSTLSREVVIKGVYGKLKPYLALLINALKI